MSQRRFARPVLAVFVCARRLLAKSLILTGAVLVVFTVRSRLISPPAIQPAESPTNYVRRPGFPIASDQRALSAALRSGQPDEPFNLGIVNRLVYRATLHTDEREISFDENWLQWSLARFYSPLARIQDSERLAVGVGANCSERAQILKTLVANSGRRCRFIGLNGHVLLEVETENGWCVADPDYGVVYPVNMERLTQADSLPLIWFRLGSRGYHPGVIKSYISMVQSTDDNVTLPIGTALSPRLYGIEVACQWLVWWIPGVTLLVGWALLREQQPLVRSTWQTSNAQSG